MGSNADKLLGLRHLSLISLSQNAYTWISWHFYMSQPDQAPCHGYATRLFHAFFVRDQHVTQLCLKAFWLNLTSLEHPFNLTS